MPRSRIAFRISSPSRPGNVRSSRIASNDSVVMGKNAPSPGRPTPTVFFPPSSPSRRALATFCSSSTTRILTLEEYQVRSHKSEVTTPSDLHDDVGVVVRLVGLGVEGGAKQHAS